MSEKIKVKITKSYKKEKKLKAVFTYPDGKTKTTHFGQSGADDYTLTKDKDARERYRKRHKKDLKTDDFWTIDICELNETNNFNVLEIGCFSCAGLYGCNLGKIVEEISS